MNFFEQAVHEYLTQTLGLLTLPDMKVKRNEEGKSWSAQIDFVALDFGTNRILLVEVTANRDFPQWLVNKVTSLKDTQTINWHVRTKVLKGEIQDSYRLAWLLVVPEKHVRALRKETAAFPCEVIPLENVLQQLASGCSNENAKQCGTLIAEAT